jgi:translation elongation factor EF-4
VIAGRKKKTPEIYVVYLFISSSLLLDRYQQSDLVKMDILLNGQPVDAMATIVHNQKAQRVGRELVEKLKKFIERYSSTSFLGHVNCA